jgi:HSP20 family protein
VISRDSAAPQKLRRTPDRTGAGTGRSSLVPPAVGGARPNQCKEVEMARSESTEMTRTTPLRLMRPFSLLDEVEREFGDFFRSPMSAVAPSWWPAARAASAVAPTVDIYEDDGNVVLKAEIPGVAKENLDVKIVENVLTISGEKKKEEKVEEQDYCRMERSFGAFTRSYMLPTSVQADKVKARFKDGILEVTIPKTEEALRKERKIAIE